MKLLKYLAPIVAVWSICSTPLVAQDFATMDAVDERDSQAMQQFIRSKRGLFLEDKVNNLNISGDVRVEYKNISEKHRVPGGPTVKIRGGCNLDMGPIDPGVIVGNPGFVPYGSNVFDVEFNLYFDYVAERTWASVWLEFDNRMGLQDKCGIAAGTSHGPTNIDAGDRGCYSGSCSELCLRSAYFGYNILEEGTSRLDIEMGRRPFYKVFDSRVQFNNNFDGVLLRYANTFDGVGDFYVQGGLFIVDSNAPRVGWIVEAGLLDIADVNVDFKYSYNDYGCNDTRYCGAGSTNFANACKFLTRFRISQFTLGYSFNPEMLQTDVRLYGAFLINHSANNIVWGTSGRRLDECLAWYIGAMFGGIEREGDWAIDFNFQWVGAQAVHGSDVSGIGRGNAFAFCLLPDDTGIHEAFGNTNYLGFLVEAMYALTDNLMIGLEYEQSWELESAIGGDHDYRKIEVNFNYGW